MEALDNAWYYMEDLEKPQNCQNWGVGGGPLLGDGHLHGQYGSSMQFTLFVRWLKTSDFCGILSIYSAIP